MGKRLGPKGVLGVLIPPATGCEWLERWADELERTLERQLEARVAQRRIEIGERQPERLVDTRASAAAQLAGVGESEDGSGEAFQWTADREQRLAGRPPLPPGAICFESGLTGLPGRLCLATFELTDEELRCTAISEPLDAAIEMIGQRLGALVELRDRTVAPLQYDLSPHGARAPQPRAEPPPGLSAAEADELEAQVIDDHYRRWLDQPLQSLGGHSPRQAATSSARGELEAILRSIENRAERARRDGTPWPDLAWLRDERPNGVD